MRLIQKLLLVLVLVFFVPQALAIIPLVNVLDSKYDEDISSQLEHISGFKDAKWPWDVSFQGWRPYTPNSINIFSEKEDKVHSNWFRFRLANNSGDSIDLVLSIDNRFLNTVDVFVKNSHGALERVWYTGVDRGMNSKPYPSSMFSFPIKINNHNSKVVYIKTVSTVNPALTFRVQDVTTFSLNDAFTKSFSGLVVGIIFIAFMYSLSMYLFIHEIRFANYSILTAFLLLTLFITGSYMTLFTTFAERVNVLNTFLCANFFLLISFLLVGGEYVDPVLRRISKYIQISLSSVCALGAALVWVIPFYVSIVYHVFCFSAIALWFLSVLLYNFKQHNMVRAGYSFVTFMCLIGVVIPSLTSVGVLKDLTYTKISIESVACSISVILTFIFGYRIYKERLKSRLANKYANMNKKNYLQMFKLSNEGMVFIDEDGGIRSGNKAICRILGYKNITDLKQSSALRFQQFCVEPSQFEALIGTIILKRSELYEKNKLKDIEKTVASNNIYVKSLIDSTGVAEYDTKYLSEISYDKNKVTKKLVSVSIRMAEDHNGTYGMVCEIKDLSITEINKEKTYNLTYVDQLTGAYNRNYLVKELGLLCSENKENEDGTRTYLAIVKLNNIKYINSVIGHDNSYDFLKLIVSTVNDKLKDKRASLSRLSDDRLAIVFYDNYSNAVYEIAKECRDEINDLVYEFDNSFFTITANFGIIDIRAGNGNVPTLMSYAEAVCKYSCDNKGTNQIVIWFNNVEQLLDLNKNVHMSSEILHAIQEGRIYVNKMQIDHITDNTYSDSQNLEYFASIESVDRSIYIPYSFERLIECFNILPKLDIWLINKIVEYYSSNFKEGICSNSRFFINIHYETLCDRDLFDDIVKKFSSVPHLAERACVQISEVKILEHKLMISQQLPKLAELGVKFALVNFSNINVFTELTNIKFEYVKIDTGSFENLNEDSNEILILKNVVVMLKSLKIEVIATNVDTARIYQLVTSLGIKYCQGCYVGKATVADFSIMQVNTASNDTLENIAIEEDEPFIDHFEDYPRKAQNQ
ncbi:MAG: EAL domain-containing protein [Succinivibrionaceae bacterium]